MEEPTLSSGSVPHEATQPSRPVNSIVDRLKGAMSAVITPFDTEGHVDVKALVTIVEKQIEQGINGFIACGTTGETPTLDAAERELVVRTVVRTAAGRVPVIAGTGTNSTQSSIEGTQLAASWGVDAALVVCPYYNKPTQEGLIHHFRAVAKDGGLPVIAYNVPGRTVSDMQAETAIRLAKEGAIIGIKDATANMIRATDMRAGLPGDWPFAFLSGDDFTILPYMACGGDGVISVVSNICPRDTAQLVKLCTEGKYEQARPLHNQLVRLSYALFSSSNPIPLKAALALGGWCKPTTRLPLVTPDEAIMDTMRDALKTYTGNPELDLTGFMS